MALRKAKFLDQYDFSGGVNIKDPPDRLDVKECFCNKDSYEGTLNVYFDGSVKRRAGTLLQNDVPGSPPTRIDAGIKFYRSEAPASTIFFTAHYSGETKICYLAGTTITPVGGGSAIGAAKECSFTPWLDKLYVAGGDQVIQVISYSGGWNRADINGLAGTAQLIVQHKNRLFAAGGGMDDGYFECTDYNDAESWAAGNGEAFYVGYKSGDSILQILPLGDNFVIYCKKSIWMLRGDNLYNWFQDKDESEVGLLASRAVADVGNDTHIFVGSDENVWAFRDAGMIRIGDNIQPWIKRVPTARKDNICATYSGDFFRMSLSQTGASVNNLELVLDLRKLQRQISSWWPNTGRSISCYIPSHGPGDEIALYAGDDAAPYIRKLDTGKQDDGVDIPFSLQSGYHTFGLETVEKLFDRCKVTTNAGVGTFTFTLFKETNNEYSEEFILDAPKESVTFGTAVLGTSYYLAQGQARIVHEIALKSLFDAYAISYKIAQAGNYPTVEFFGVTLNYRGKKF